MDGDYAVSCMHSNKSETVDAIPFASCFVSCELEGISIHDFCEYIQHDLMPCVACRPSHPLITRVTDWSEVEEALASKFVAKQP